MAHGNTTGVEVHYMDDGYFCFTHSKDRTIYLFTDENGRRDVDAIDVTTHLVAEWLDSTGRDDDEILNEVWEAMQNGVSDMTGIESVSENLGLRSMMVGDVVALQTNNRGPKRQYVVANVGFERIA